MTYMKQDISAENQFLLFDFQMLLEEMEESMEKCYQTLENTNTESLKSKLIIRIQTGKDIEKEISELVDQYYDNGDSLEDILDDNYAEFVMDYKIFRGFFQNSQTKTLMERIDYSNQQRDVILGLNSDDLFYTRYIYLPIFY